jgi:hypothetical protein
MLVRRMRDTAEQERHGGYIGRKGEQQMTWLGINPMADEDPYNDGPTDDQIAAQDRYECEKDYLWMDRQHLRDAGRGHLC